MLLAVATVTTSCEETTDIDSDTHENSDDSNDDNDNSSDNNESSSENGDDNIDDSENGNDNANNNENENENDSDEEEDYIYEGTEFTLATIPTDGSTIDGDIWVITDGEAPDLDEFANLKSALKSAGEERDIIIYMPNITHIIDCSITNSYNADGDYISDEYNDNLIIFSAPNAIWIGDRVFRNCLALTAISLPQVSDIGYGAFDGCENIESISLPTASIIVDYAMRNCSSLKSVSLPAATEIRYCVFDGCSSLTSLILATESQSLSVSSSVFGDCTLSNIDLVTGINNGSSVSDNYWSVNDNALGEFKSITIE